MRKTPAYSYILLVLSELPYNYNQNKKYVGKRENGTEDKSGIIFIFGLNEADTAGFYDDHITSALITGRVCN